MAGRIYLTIQRLLDDPDLLARLRANVRPPMTMEEHVERLEAIYAQIVDRNPASW